MVLFNAIPCRVLVYLALILAVLQVRTPALAEIYIGSNVDSRVYVAFKVNEKAAQEWLPADWTLTPLPEGPFAGANLLVVLVDTYLYLDAEGKPATPASFRSVALASLAGREGSDEKRQFVTRVYVTDPSVNSYKNSIPARIGRSATYNGEADARTRSEKWSVSPEGGGEMTLEISYGAEGPTWSAREARPYSAAEPDFHRIYRYEQLGHLVMSAPLGKKPAGEITFATTISELAEMFDGSEEMVGVVVAPVYMRKLYLP
jgi:hypothetical protein